MQCDSCRFIVINQPPLGAFPLFKPPFVPDAQASAVQVRLTPGCTRARVPVQSLVKVAQCKGRP